MNERIKLLAEQAGFTEGGYESDDGPWIGPEFDKEKFAELLVQECVNMAESFHRHQYDFTGNLELHEFIKIHFGVKE
tara:strand:+ start:743 stop:973 length:231 start_codon:yes stop_codon:yes gene_type:complete